MCVCMCMYIYMYIYIYVYTYMYIHTCICVTSIYASLGVHTSDIACPRFCSSLFFQMTRRVMTVSWLIQNGLRVDLSLRHLAAGKPNSICRYTVHYLTRLDHLDPSNNL